MSLKKFFEDEWVHARREPLSAALSVFAGACAGLLAVAPFLR